MVVDWTAIRAKERQIQKDIKKYEAERRVKSLQRTVRLGKEQGKQDVVSSASKHLKTAKKEADKYKPKTTVTYKTKSGGTQTGVVQTIGGKQFVISVGKPGELEAPELKAQIKTTEVVPAYKSAKRVTPKTKIVSLKEPSVWPGVVKEGTMMSTAEGYVLSSGEVTKDRERAIADSKEYTKAVSYVPKVKEEYYTPAAPVFDFKAPVSMMKDIKEKPVETTTVKVEPTLEKPSTVDLTKLKLGASILDKYYKRDVDIKEDEIEKFIKREEPLVGIMVPRTDADKIATQRMIDLYNKEATDYKTESVLYKDPLKEKQLSIQREKLSTIIRKKYPDMKTEVLLVDPTKVETGKDVIQKEREAQLQSLQPQIDVSKDIWFRDPIAEKREKRRLREEVEGGIKESEEDANILIGDAQILIGDINKYQDNNKVLQERQQKLQNNLINVLNVKSEYDDLYRQYKDTGSKWDEVEKAYEKQKIAVEKHTEQVDLFNKDIVVNQKEYFEIEKKAETLEGYQNQLKDLEKNQFAYIKQYEMSIKKIDETDAIRKRKLKYQQQFKDAPWLVKESEVSVAGALSLTPVGDIKLTIGYDAKGQPIKKRYGDITVKEAVKIQEDLGIPVPGKYMISPEKVMSGIGVFGMGAASIPQEMGEILVAGPKRKFTEDVKEKGFKYVAKDILGVSGWLPEKFETKKYVIAGKEIEVKEPVYRDPATIRAAASLPGAGATKYWMRTIYDWRDRRPDEKPLDIVNWRAVAGTIDTALLAFAAFKPVAAGAKATIMGTLGPKAAKGLGTFAKVAIPAVIVGAPVYGETKQVLAGQETIGGAVSDVITEVAYTGGKISALTAGMATLSSPYTPRLTYEKITKPTVGGEQVAYKGLGWKAGDKGGLIIGKVKTETMLRGGKELKVIRDATGHFTRVGPNLPDAYWRVGTPYVSLKDLYRPISIKVGAATLPYNQAKNSFTYAGKTYHLNSQYQIVTAKGKVLNTLGGKPTQVDFSGYIVESPAQAKIMAKSLKARMPAREYSKLFDPKSGAVTLGKETYKITGGADKFIRETNTLNRQGIDDVMEFTKNYDATIYGTYSARPQMRAEDWTQARGVTGKPADIDIYVSLTQKKTEVVANQLANQIAKTSSYPIRVHGTLIQTKIGGVWKNAVDIHSVNVPQPYASYEVAETGSYGVPFTGRTTPIEGIKAQTIGEQAARKMASTFSLAPTPGKPGQFQFFPQPYRAKDIADYFGTLRSAAYLKKTGSADLLSRLGILQAKYPASLTTPGKVSVPIFRPSPSSSLSLGLLGGPAAVIPQTSPSPWFEPAKTSVLISPWYEPSPGFLKSIAYSPSSVKLESLLRSPSPSPYPSPYPSLSPSPSMYSPPSPTPSPDVSTSPSTEVSPEISTSVSPSPGPSPYIFSTRVPFPVIPGLPSWMRKGYPGLGQKVAPTKEWTVVNPIRDLGLEWKKRQYVKELAFAQRKSQRTQKGKDLSSMFGTKNLNTNKLKMVL